MGGGDPTRRRWRAVLALLVASLLLVGAAAATPAGRTLVVEDAATGEHLLAVPVSEGTPVALEYTHSVEKTRVLDAYVVRGDRLEMTRMEFESYGWGLPANANVSTENGSFVFDPDRSYRELHVTPGDVAGHRLYVGSRTYDLLALAGERSVRLHLVERSVLARALDGLPTGGSDRAAPQHGLGTTTATTHGP